MSKPKKNQSNQQPPNIAFVGSKDGLEPLRTITNGDRVIELPEDQEKPFYHAEAHTITRLYGWLYKPVVQK